MRATIAMARVIKQAQPRLWDFCLKLRKKDAVLAEIGGLTLCSHLGHVWRGARLHGTGVSLAPHPTNKNGSSCGTWLSTPPSCLA